MSPSFIHADIFFFVTTIALIIGILGMVITFVYVIGILRNVRQITEKAKKEWDEIIADSQKLRGVLRDEGMKWMHIVDIVRNFFTKRMVVTSSKKIKHVRKQKTEQEG